MEKIRRYIEVKGVVQGVGFRPYVYNLAHKYNILGWVNNSNKGVLIDVEGFKKEVEGFIGYLKSNPPQLAIIKNIQVTELEYCGYSEFNIVRTEEKNINKTYISPDYSICDKCKEEMFDKNNKRFKYAFTNCTNCGPRFSIIESMPYDREFTTMSEFTMCENCAEEYDNPSDRRFHAQPNGCHNCGPSLCFLNSNGEIIKTNNYIKEAASKIASGNIVAIKGLGGYNLCCDGKNERSINILRERKNRPSKPLALMMKDMDTIKSYCHLSLEEEKALLSNKRPIVLLEKSQYYNLPENIAPNNKRIGVMLPYTPMHYLMFEENIQVLVMTSGNLSGRPIIYNDIDAIKSFKNIADYILTNNRKINMPIDDSVVIVLNNKERVIRPGRGYCPNSLNIDTFYNIIAYGTEMKNTIAISNTTDIFYSPYIGDLSNKETLKRHEIYLEHLSNIYNVKPKILAMDMHPDFEYRNNTFLQEERNIPIIEVQHHHGHIVSCMVENDLYNNVLGIAFDGTGYGDDKNIWGGEFLICSRKDYRRVGHVNYFKLPAGESSIKDPWKIAVSLLFSTFGNEYENYIPEHIKNRNHKIITKSISKNINCMDTSSVGRFFDGVSALIGFNSKVTFEGEAAVWLQNISDINEYNYYNYEIIYHKEKFTLNYENIIKEVVQDMVNKIPVNIIGGKFHRTIINSTVEIAEKVCEKFKINNIALSGGVFQNEILFNSIVLLLEEKGYKVYTHKVIPCNDSGVSIGQVIVANENC